MRLGRTGNRLVFTRERDTMAVNLVVALTDYDWFQALRMREDWPEVNFWAPSATNFRALQPGEFFLFKLHAPRHFIVGGGVFAHSMTLPCSLAWEIFRSKWRLRPRRDASAHQALSKRRPG